MRMGLLMNIRTIFLGLAAFGLTLAAPLAQAQTARPGLDAATASTIIAACEAYAVEHELALTIAVFDEGANLQGLLRMDGAILASLGSAKPRLIGLPSIMCPVWQRCRAACRSATPLACSLVVSAPPVLPRPTTKRARWPVLKRPV